MPRILELLVGIGTPFVYIFMLLVQGKRPFYLAYHFGFGKGAAEWLRTHPGAEHIISMCVGLLCGLVIANQINNGPTMLSKEVDSETRKAIAEAEEKQKMVLDKLSDVRTSPTLKVTRPPDADVVLRHPRPASHTRHRTHRRRRTRASL